MPAASAGTESIATSKLQTIIVFLRRPDGAVIEELAAATSWQKHSVRGAISGALKKKYKLQISSTMIEGRGRVYRIETDETEQPLAVDGDVGGQP